MTDILPSTADGLRRALEAEGFIVPADADYESMRAAYLEPVTVDLPDVDTEWTKAYAELVQRVAQGTVDALWRDGWRPQATEPEPTVPAYKATVNGAELTIVAMPRRVTRRQVVRDKQGRIVETLDVEEDA